MKKVFLLAILLTSFSNIFANFATQGNWRWRKDDGSQTTATWLAEQNTPIVLTSASESIRIRIELYNDPAMSGGTLTDALFESSIDSLTWDTIKVIPDPGSAFMLAGSSPNVIDKEPTTQQLTSPHYTNFQAGKIILATNKLPSSTLGDNFGTEYEYVIKPTANILPSTKYYFRVDAANYKAGMTFPTLTTASILPIKLSAFSVKSEGKKVKLEWSTQSEQNNDRFDVQRSTNGRTWETITKVKGKGTSSVVSNYSAYDNSPSTGVNYYRIQQYDINGQFTSSEVKSLKFFNSTRPVVSVTPNPAKSGINFKLENSIVTTVLAILSDANGKIVYQQTFKDVQANTMNKLNLKQQPMPGMYVLQLKGEGLSESIKVVVQ